MERVSLAELGKWYVSAVALYTTVCCTPERLTVLGNTWQTGSSDLCKRDLFRKKYQSADGDFCEQQIPSLPPQPLCLRAYLQTRQWLTCLWLLEGPIDLGIRPLDVISTTLVLVGLKCQKLVRSQPLPLRMHISHNHLLYDQSSHSQLMPQIFPLLSTFGKH